jgi:hypothetical protein
MVVQTVTDRPESCNRERNRSYAIVHRYDGLILGHRSEPRRELAHLLVPTAAAPAPRANADHGSAGQTQHQPISRWLMDQLVTVTAEQGFPHWRAMGTICRGWVKIKNGDVAEGISLLRSGSVASRATGAWRPHNVALLAAACEIAWQIDEALALSDDALQIADRTGEHWLEAEVYRHKGQLLLRQGFQISAEDRGLGCLAG